MSDSLVWVEKQESGSISYEPLSVTKLYTLRGPADHNNAWLYASMSTAPTVIACGQVLYRQNITCNPLGYIHWDVEATYGERKNALNEYQFRFSTTGGTLRLTMAKEHIAEFPAAGAPDFDGAIDVQGDEVRGTDVIIPALKLTYDFRFPSGIVNEATAVKYARLTGQTNSKAWHGFAIGECLFLGANGGDGTSTEATVSFEIAASQNLANATIGAITGVNKKGWEIAWVSFKRDVDGGKPIVKPERIYVERVYDSFDFAAQLGF